MPFNSISEGLPGPPGPAGPGTFTQETSIVSVLDYGATGDGVTGDRNAIYEAIADASNHELLFPAGTYRVESELTFGSTVAVRFLNGAKLSIDSGVTVTINGPLQAGLHEIFSGDGSANIGRGAVPMVYPQWWGAVGDDSTDNSGAFNKALEAVQNVGVLYIPTGTYQLFSPIDTFPVNYFSYQRTGIVIRGAGMKDTILKYKGASGYCIEMEDADSTENKKVSFVTITDLHIMAPDIGVADGGGVLFGSANCCQLERVAFTEINETYGTAIHARKRNIAQSSAMYINDTNRDFTSSGAGVSEKYAIKFTSQPAATDLKQITVKLGRTGTPAGTITAYIYDDNSGKPGLQIGGASNSIDCSSLSTYPDGDNVTFTFELYEDMPPLSASTIYWVVLATSGYTYTDGATEVRLRVEDAAGGADGFATYNAGASTWSTSNDGSNLAILHRYGQCLNNRLRQVYLYGGTLAHLGVKMEENSQFHISDCKFVCKNCLQAEGENIIWVRSSSFNGSTDGRPIDVYGGESSWSQCYAEGGSITNTCRFRAGSRHTITDSHLAVYLAWEVGYPPEISNCYGPLYYYDDASMLYKERYKIIDAHSPHMSYSAGGGILADDPDALNGKCIELNAQHHNVIVGWQYTSERQFTYLTRGTYMMTVYAKDNNQLADDLRLEVRQDDPSLQLAHIRYTCTGSYEPYRILFHVGSSQVGKYLKLIVQKASDGTNNIYVSHIIFEYLGPDSHLNYDTISYNQEPSDADGGRNNRHIFIGRQSGGEQSVLASIAASHYGPEDDQKGKLEIGINNGYDNFSPTTRVTIDSDGDIAINGRLHSDSLITFTNGDTTPSVLGGNIFRTENSEVTTITTFDDGTVGQVVIVIIGDDKTEMDFTGTNLKGNAGQDWFPGIGDHMTCVFDGANWYCNISDNTP